MDLLERLGLSGKRVLLLHHDDLGLTHAQNGAYQALGFPTGSVMVPGAWASGVKGEDLGVHLVLTSEWTAPRMRPSRGARASGTRRGISPSLRRSCGRGRGRRRWRRSFAPDRSGPEALSPHPPGHPPGGGPQAGPGRGLPAPGPGRTASRCTSRRTSRAWAFPRASSPTWCASWSGPPSPGCASWTLTAFPRRSDWASTWT